jgi:ParB family chromosome partitioning protein
METQALVPLDQIDPNPYQPRQSMDPTAVAELAENIKRNTLLQVPSARQVDGRYQLAFGHRRLAAFQLNAEECMPLIIRELDDLQMFELGVAENIKRRDLNPIEEARAMRRYMDDFGKTSTEAGEFFSVSPEKVRQLVRLLNLPEPAQEKLAAGAITQTTARTLLSMQKVAPPEALVETLERLEKGVSRWGDPETPEEIIEDVMNELEEEEVKELWSGHRDGKPRAGASDAWLLDMKNFPNKFLPVLTPVDAAIALGIQDDEEKMEKVATWIQASLGELPDLDTESLGIPLVLLAMLDHLVNPPACTACPFYSVVQENHYCGMETCFTRKTRAWEYEKLRAASKNLKIEIYNAETDGEFRVLEDTYNGQGEHYKIFQARSKDLRLALAVDIDRKKQQHGYHLPSSVVVMLVGQTLKDLLAKGQKERAAKRSKEQADALLARLLEEKREALDWELAAHVKTIFDGMNLAALEAFWDTPGRYGSQWEVNRHTLPADRKPSKDASEAEQADFLRHVYAMNMVRKVGGYYNKTISEYVASAGEVIKRWGVKLPKSIIKLAAQMDEEIKTATTETEE